MPNRWESSNEKVSRIVQDLLPVQVVLRDDQWFTIAMRGSMGAALQEPRSMSGLDVGGIVHLNSDIHKQIADGDMISAYVIGRRGVRSIDQLKLMANNDEFRRRPGDLQRIRYEVVISFATDGEAVSFALMFS